MKQSGVMAAKLQLSPLCHGLGELGVTVPC